LDDDDERCSQPIITSMSVTKRLASVPFSNVRGECMAVISCFPFEDKANHIIVFTGRNAFGFCDVAVYQKGILLLTWEVKSLEIAFDYASVKFNPIVLHLLTSHLEYFPKSSWFKRVKCQAKLATRAKL
jgi:hypothetical protein